MSQGNMLVEGTNGVRLFWIRPVERTFYSIFCKVQIIPHHISGEKLQLIVRLSREGHWQVDIDQIMCLTQGYICKILRWTRQTGFPVQMSLGHHQSISTHGGQYLLRMMRAKRFLSVKSHVKSQANSSHCTLPCQYVPSLGIFLLWDIILVGRHAALDWLKCIVGTAISGQDIIVFGTSTNVSSLTTRFSLYHPGGWSRVCRRHCERHIGVCMQRTDDDVSPSLIVWAWFHYDGKIELVVLAPWTSKCTDVCCKSFTLGESPLPEQLCPGPK